MKLKKLLFDRGLRQIQLIRLMKNLEDPIDITPPRLSNLIAGKLKFSDDEKIKVRSALRYFGVPSTYINRCDELRDGA